MDDVKERVEELAMTAISETYNLQAGSPERQRAVQDAATLVECLDKIRATDAKIENDVERIKIEQDKNDIESEKNRDETQLKEREISVAEKDGKKKVWEIVVKGVVGVGIPLIMLIDEHSDGLLPRKILTFWSKPRI